MMAQNLRSSQWRFVWPIGSTDCCRIDACGWIRTQAPQGGGFHPEIVGGAIAWSLPPLATRVAAKLFSLFSNVVQGEIPNNLPLQFLEGKDRKMSAVDRAAVRVLKGEITLEKVGRHRVTKGAVKSRLTRLKNGVQKTGRKPALAMEIEQQLATYIDDHTAAGMCHGATWGWWRRFKGRWPSVVTRWKEAVKLERLYAENPESGTGETENWALCDTCQQWIHDGCYGLVWSRDGAYVEQEDSHWQCTMCRPSSDAAAASDGEYSQTHVSGSDSA